MTEKNDFNPDWLSPPGDTIADILGERSLSPGELGQRIGWNQEQVMNLIHGRTSITTDLAHQLATLLGSSAAFWMKRESQYRQDARRGADLRSADEKGWLRELPVADMLKYAWIHPTPPKGHVVGACLDFFGVPNVPTWRATYNDVLQRAALRTSPSFQSQPGAVVTWLRQGELEAISIKCAPWNATRFRALIPSLRPLTRKKTPSVFLPELRRLCAACGVAVVVARAPGGCRASGATRFLSADKALLLLSFRYLSDDQFWFTFFHEAGHLLLHTDKWLFLEGIETHTIDEKEANVFAANALIPQSFHSELSALRLELRDIAGFARRVGVSPGIVIGQLQHEGRVPHDHWNALKVRFDWDAVTR
jgi:plasmid maintenance system antidote protein VapI